MYIERIKYQIIKDGIWNVGYYIGAGENCDNSTFLDKNYKAYDGDIWDYRPDYQNRIIISVPEKEEI